MAAQAAAGSTEGATAGRLRYTTAWERGKSNKQMFAEHDYRYRQWKLERRRTLQ